MVGEDLGNCSGLETALFPPLRFADPLSYMNLILLTGYQVCQERGGLQEKMAWVSNGASEEK